MSLSHPVNHKLQVAEVAHAVAAFRTQREYGDERARHLLVAKREERLVEHSNVSFSLVHSWNVKHAVFASLPKFVALIVERHELELHLHILSLYLVHVACLLVALQGSVVGSALQGFYTLGVLQSHIAVNVDVHHPFVMVLLSHRNRLGKVPVAEEIACTQ